MDRPEVQQSRWLGKKVKFDDADQYHYRDYWCLCCVKHAPVKVRRQPDDRRIATYDLQNVWGLRWDNVGGGVMRGSAMHVYGYVMCDGMIDGELAHSCRHGPPPHEIKVCITKKHNEQLWPQILQIVGPKPKRV
jgi:hypothetical protein